MSMQRSSLWAARLAGCAFVLALSSAALAEAQPVHRAPVVDRGDQPSLVTFGGDRAGISDRALVRWGALDLTHIRAEDAEMARAGERRVRIGVNRAAPLGDLRAPLDGEIVRARDGSVVWRLALQSEDAVGLRVHFPEFDLPEGGRLVMADADGGKIVSYTGKGPIGNGEFWSEPLYADTVLIEYQSEDDLATLPQIRISAVSHFYRLSSHDDGAAGERGSILCSLEDPNCHLNLGDPAQVTARDAVGRYTFMEGAFGFLCSGCLIEDNDPNTYAGYFLSAAHCVDSQSVANTMVIYWHYGTPQCVAPTPNLNNSPTSVGALLLGQSVSSDYSFFRLYEDPSDGQTFAPMSFNEPSSGQDVHMIHHPGGSWKRYSRGTFTGDDPFCAPSGSIHTWDWDIGMIEGGSSGSPLFNENFEVIGALTGICWYCIGEGCPQPNCDTNQSSWVNYGPRVTAAESLISSFLNTMAQEDEYEGNDELVESTPLPLGTHDLHLVDFDDYFTIELCEPGTITVSIDFDTGDMDANLKLLNSTGSPLRQELAPSGIGSVTGSFETGIYHIHVERISGWGGPYELVVEAGDDENENGVPDACEAPACPGDINGSGAVDALDLAIVVGNWGACPSPPCSWDMNGDGQVTAVDIATLLSFWGPCP